MGALCTVHEIFSHYIGDLLALQSISMPRDRLDCLAFMWGFEDVMMMTDMKLVGVLMRLINGHGCLSCYLDVSVYHPSAVQVCQALKHLLHNGGYLYFPQAL